jgi:hypothetical protein
MDVSERFFEMVYNIVKMQNEYLLHEIAIREKINVQTLMKEFTPSKKQFRDFIRRQIQGENLASGE